MSSPSIVGLLFSFLLFRRFWARSVE
ncbi:MAG: hypothetical protein K0S98_2166, partial [Propionibacteriaceae bacterium]|nr:hypothetical protein [Propionibacteriaceae bacterium]